MTVVAPAGGGLNITGETALLLKGSRLCRWIHVSRPYRAPCATESRRATISTQPMESAYMISPIDSTQDRVQRPPPRAAPAPLYHHRREGRWPRPDYARPGRGRANRRLNRPHPRQRGDRPRLSWRAVGLGYAHCRCRRRDIRRPGPDPDRESHLNQFVSNQRSPLALYRSLPRDCVIASRNH